MKVIKNTEWKFGTQGATFAELRQLLEEAKAAGVEDDAHLYVRTNMSGGVMNQNGLRVTRIRLVTD